MSYEQGTQIHLVRLYRNRNSDLRLSLGPEKKIGLTCMMLAFESSGKMLTMQDRG